MGGTGQYAIFAFFILIEAPEQLATQPHDDDINGCYWVTAQEIINSQQLRSPLVKKVFFVINKMNVIHSLYWIALVQHLPLNNDFHS